MAGLAVSFNNFRPIHYDNDESMDNHEGEIDVLMTNVYGLYGLTDALNLTVRFPYKYWKQYDVEHEDAHHRNQDQTGLGDLTLGLRRIVLNENFGPGQRLFIDGAVTLPTGKDYSINPFGNTADSIDHTHFALGTGQVSYTLGAEWWVRSEFPFIMGISSKFKSPLTESNAGFSPGTVAGLTFHAIKQSPLIKSIFPYLKIQFRREWPDKWAGAIAPNSGAIFIDMVGQLIYEVNEHSSLVFTIGYPLWQVLEGSQLSSINYALSYRFKSF
ncbi:MAG TPA: hypothetical protein EYO13_00595 [Candidatus Marinimicrobia bacterium]|nr:hypothetical protein [Candidatus Neomarinimicrobiota bacterium]